MKPDSDSGNSYNKLNPAGWQVMKRLNFRTNTSTDCHKSETIYKNKYMMVGSQAKLGDREHEKNKAYCFLAYCHRYYFAVVFQSCYSWQCFQRRRHEWVNIIKVDVAMSSPLVLTIIQVGA